MDCTEHSEAQRPKEAIVKVKYRLDRAKRSATKSECWASLHSVEPTFFDNRLKGLGFLGFKPERSFQIEYK